MDLFSRQSGIYDCGWRKAQPSEKNVNVSGIKEKAFMYLEMTLGVVRSNLL